MNRSGENRLDLEAGVLEIVEAKHGSTGIVPLDIGTLRVLRHYAGEIRPRVRNADTLDRVFLSKTGKPYTPNTLTQKFRLMLARLGCPGHTAHENGPRGATRG